VQIKPLYKVNAILVCYKNNIPGVHAFFKHVFVIFEGRYDDDIQQYIIDGGKSHQHVTIDHAEVENNHQQGKNASACNHKEETLKYYDD